MANDVLMKVDLEYGYTDKAGTTHKTAEIRRLTPRDIMSIQLDPELQAMAGKPWKMTSGNPAEQAMVMAVSMTLDIILLQRVLVRIGTVEGAAITRDLIEQLDITDIVRMTNGYKELHGLKDDGGGAHPLLNAL